eukprot:g3130.t1
MEEEAARSCGAADRSWAHCGDRAQKELGVGISVWLNSRTGKALKRFSTVAAEGLQDGDLVTASARQAKLTSNHRPLDVGMVSAALQQERRRRCSDLIELLPVKWLHMGSGQDVLSLGQVQSFERSGVLGEDELHHLEAALMLLMRLISALASCLDVTLPFPCSAGRGLREVSSAVEAATAASGMRERHRRSSTGGLAYLARPRAPAGAPEWVLPCVQNPFTRTWSHFSVYDNICTSEFAAVLRLVDQDLLQLCRCAGVTSTPKGAGTLQLLAALLRAEHLGCISPPGDAEGTRHFAVPPNRLESGHEDGEWTVLDVDDRVRSIQALWRLHHPSQAAKRAACQDEQQVKLAQTNDMQASQARVEDMLSEPRVQILILGSLEEDFTTAVHLDLQALPPPDPRQTEAISYPSPVSAKEEPLPGEDPAFVKPAEEEEAKEPEPEKVPELQDLWLQLQEGQRLWRRAEEPPTLLNRRSLRIPCASVKVFAVEGYGAELIRRVLHSLGWQEREASATPGHPPQLLWNGSTSGRKLFKDEAWNLRDHCALEAKMPLMSFMPRSYDLRSSRELRGFLLDFAVTKAESMLEVNGTLSPPAASGVLQACRLLGRLSHAQVLQSQVLCGQRGRAQIREDSKRAWRMQTHE